MENIIDPKNHTFDLFKDYFQNIRSAMKQDDKGRWVDPFGNVIRSVKTDRNNNLTGLYLGPVYGDSGIVLYGSPDGLFNIQASDNGDMYAYLFNHGVLMEERKSDRSGYVSTKYGPQSEGRPVAQSRVYHGGPFEEKRWTSDGKTLIYKKTHSMDKDRIEKTTREFLDGHDKRCLRIDWTQDRLCMQTEMYHMDDAGKYRLKWLCERDHKGRLIFYKVKDNEMFVTNVVLEKNGKRHHIKITPQNISAGAAR